MSKFTRTTICCSSCNKQVTFELIEDIECDWGSHDVIQCPNCQELFSIDMPCQAFSDLTLLIPNNPGLLDESEKIRYLKESHLF